MVLEGMTKPRPLRQALVCMHEGSPRDVTPGGFFGIFGLRLIPLIGLYLGGHFKPLLHLEHHTRAYHGQAIRHGHVQGVLIAPAVDAVVPRIEGVARVHDKVDEQKLVAALNRACEIGRFAPQVGQNAANLP